MIPLNLNRVIAKVSETLAKANAESDRKPLRLCDDCPINKGWSRAMVFLIVCICSLAVIMTAKNGISEASLMGLLTLAGLAVGFIDRSLKQSLIEKKQDTTQDALQQIAVKVDQAKASADEATVKTIETAADLATTTKATAAELAIKVDQVHANTNGEKARAIEEAYKRGVEEGQRGSKF